MRGSLIGSYLTALLTVACAGSIPPTSTTRSVQQTPSYSFEPEPEYEISLPVQLFPTPFPFDIPKEDNLRTALITLPPVPSLTIKGYNSMGCVNPQEQKIMFAFELSDLLTGRRADENPQSFRSLLGSAHYQLQSTFL